jgi:ABC-2 type transport system permease protein
MAVNSILRTVKQSIWLGWKIDTNWADPLVFAIYYLVRPLAGLLIVGFIFLVGSWASSSGGLNSEYFAFRAHYEVLKHIYLTPNSLKWYILGRALNGVLNATISLILTLGFGLLIFQGLLGVQIPINWWGIDFPLLALSFVIGIFCFLALGFMLCGINIMTSRVQFMLSEYVSGILYLFGGVIFLPELLPSWGQAISNALPITYFLRNIRFSILHQAGFDAQTNLAYLVLTTVGAVILGLGVFKIAEYKARKDGLIDRKEEY